MTQGLCCKRDVWGGTGQTPALEWGALQALGGDRAVGLPPAVSKNTDSPNPAIEFAPLTF